jgi:hypothetical protein
MRQPSTYASTERLIVASKDLRAVSTAMLGNNTVPESVQQWRRNKMQGSALAQRMGGAKYK